MKIPNYDVLTEQITMPEFKFTYPAFDSHMRVILCAQSGGGKTNLLLKFLIGDDTQPQLLHYDKIFIYTTTPNQGKYKALDSIYSEIATNSKIPIFHKITNTAIPDVDDFDEDNSQKVIVFDDLLCSDNKTLKRIEKFFIFGRHRNFQPIFLSQSYYDIPKVIRKNTNLFCIFGLTQRREIEAVNYDHEIDYDQFKRNTKNHDFITINKLKDTITRNIDEPVL